MTDKSTFALFFGQRGFFPASLMAAAREELPKALRAQGYGVLMMDEGATRYGAVETPREGQIYADFLRQHHGKYDGVILSLPNFGDENGAMVALQDAGVPIFIQAYPDEMDKMGPSQRRDSFCGKLSIMDVFFQSGIKFSAYKPHVVAPGSKRFDANVDQFDRVCRVVKGMRRMNVGAIGARTTPFKTVRFDEVALQRAGVTTESLDFSDVLARVRDVQPKSDAYENKAAVLQPYSSWEGVPAEAFDKLVKLAVVFDNIIDEMQLDAVALRCWTEVQQELGVCMCVLLGELNDRGIAAACEVDVCNAVVMRALALASGRPAACLDWNNNYEDDDDKCILFHCGPVPASLMSGKGQIIENPILATTLGPNCSYGCNKGRIAPGDFTFSSLITDSGRVRCYVGEGEITKDTIPEEFFGCAGVAKIDHLQDVLLHIGRYGFRHHVSLTPGEYAPALREALGYYLGYDVSDPQKGA
ncbi:MAG: L-fucose/L-arabinose isomerase family protein [Armatimonadota bacterium]